MSRAFVKEGDAELEPLPDLPQSPHANYVTPRGWAALKDRLTATQATLSALRARSDRMDKLPEAAAERDIRYLEARLRSALVVRGAADPVAVAFGCRVGVVTPEGMALHFEIVGEDEADAPQGRIAPHSPLARALMGAQVGDLVVWPRPSGAAELEVVTIETLDQTA